MSGEDKHVTNEARRNELRIRESHLGGARTAGLTRLHICIAQGSAVGHLPTHRWHPASWVKQAGKEQQAHLLGYGTSEILQYVQHLEDVKGMHHLDPLESSCLKGWEREGGVFNRGSRGSSKTKRDLAGRGNLDTRTQVQDGKWVLSNETLLTVVAAQVLSCKATSELTGKE